MFDSTEVKYLSISELAANGPAKDVWAVLSQLPIKISYLT